MTGERETLAESALNLLSEVQLSISESVDPRSKDWPFMESPVPLVLVSVCYLYFVCKTGPQYMRDKKPFNLNKVITIYNIFQISACAYIIHGMLSSYSIRQFGCEAIDFADMNSYKLAKLTWWVTMLKVTELLETVFFVFRKKQNQVSVLHLYHHVSTLSFGWVTSKFSPGEPVVIPVVLNSFIHILMYSYYLLALHGGRELQKKIAIWKRFLTISQMIQFTVIIAHLKCFKPGYYDFLIKHSKLFN